MTPLLIAGIIFAVMTGCLFLWTFYVVVEGCCTPERKNKEASPLPWTLLVSCPACLFTGSIMIVLLVLHAKLEASSLKLEAN